MYNIVALSTLLENVMHRSSMPLSTPVIAFRLMAALLLVAPVEFCIFGFLASFEPGDNLPSRIVFPVVGIFFLAAAMWLGFGAFRLQRVVLTRGIIGLCLGASIAWFASYVVTIIGPGIGDSTWAGARFALLAAPIGAAIGGALGVWIGSSRPDSRADGSAK